MTFFDVDNDGGAKPSPPGVMSEKSSDAPVSGHWTPCHPISIVTKSCPTEAFSILALMVYDAYSDGIHQGSRFVRDQLKPQSAFNNIF